MRAGGEGGREREGEEGGRKGGRGGKEGEEVVDERPFMAVLARGPQHDTRHPAGPGAPQPA